MLELIVREINVNPSAKHPLLEQSRAVREYSAFVARIREYVAQGSSGREAFRTAIESCIRDGIMAEFLPRHGSEVINMLFTKYNVEDALEVRGEERFEDGIQAGMQVGMQDGIRAMIETCMELRIPKEDIEKRLKKSFHLQNLKLKKRWKSIGKVNLRRPCGHRAFSGKSGFVKLKAQIHKTKSHPHRLRSPKPRSR